MGQVALIACLQCTHAEAKQLGAALALLPLLPVPSTLASTAFSQRKLHQAQHRCRQSLSILEGRSRGSAGLIWPVSCRWPTQSQEELYYSFWASTRARSKASHFFFSENILQPKKNCQNQNIPQNMSNLMKIPTKIFWNKKYFVSEMFRMFQNVFQMLLYSIVVHYLMQKYKKAIQYSYYII